MNVCDPREGACCDSLWRFEHSYHGNCALIKFLHYYYNYYYSKATQLLKFHFMNRTSAMPGELTWPAHSLPRPASPVWAAPASSWRMGHPLPSPEHWAPGRWSLQSAHSTHGRLISLVVQNFSVLILFLSKMHAR